jgi:GTP cyclohydrolase I
MDSKEKKEKIAFHIGKILETLGLDINDPSVAKTPFRVAKMYVDEVFSGLNPETYPEISFHSENVKNEVILVKNISLISFCEHHLVPMIGTAHASYLPSSGVLGLSKIHRIMRFYAKRPQLQERLTLQIAEKLQEELKTEDVAVAIRMKHLCVIARGVEDHSSEVETHVLKGVFEFDPTIRREFFLRITNEEN